MQLNPCGKEPHLMRRSAFKIIMVMKLITLFITIACLQVSAASFAQRVTLSEKDAPLSEVFNKIQRQSGYQFFYKGDLLGNAKISIEVKDVTVQQAMDVALKDLPLNYAITNNIIVIKKKELVPEKPAAPQPPKDVTGQVLDKNGVPLPSATVLNKRTKTGTLTDVKGNFTLHDVLPTDIIVVSYIGYKPIDVTVGEKTVFNLVLNETTNSLDQVVVQAYGTTSKRLNTGNIATVSAAEIEKEPVGNVLSAMEGKVPGLMIQQTSGYASAPFKVEIRGRSALNFLPSEPLYIIDGVPLTILENPKAGGNYDSGSTGFVQNGLGPPAGGQSPLFSINPNDIESISVLKDADATAIYGSRGANGVIIITTKTGKPGKTKVEANASYGIDIPTGQYDYLNTSQYLQLREQAFRNDGISPNSGNAYDLLIYNTKNYTDWQKYLFGGTGKTSLEEVAMSGGDKLTTFRIAMSYYQISSPLTVSGKNQKVSVQSNLTHKSADQKFTISFTNTFSYLYINEINSLSNATLPPDAPSVFNQNGSLNWTDWNPISNPFALLLQPYTEKSLFLNSSLMLNYELLKGLTLSTKFGYNTQNGQQYFSDPIIAQNPVDNPTGSAEFGTNNNVNSIVEPQIEFKNRIFKGTIDALIGSSLQYVNTNGNNIQGTGYVDDNLLHSISNAPNRNAVDNIGDYKYSSIYGRINYNWEDEYILNLSGRRDGSSRFAPGKQFGNFGAIGAAWIFTQENWLKNNLGFLSFGKVRASYGLTGSDLIGDYGFLSGFRSNSSTTYIEGVPSYTATGIGNPTLQWQVNKKLETALDLSFLKDKINFEISWYRERIGNQLLQSHLPSQTGFSYIYENLNALVQNTGTEYTLNAKVVESKDVDLTLNFEAGFNQNKLLAFPGLAQSPYASNYTVGQPLNIRKLLHYTGVDPLTGLYTFQDKNHDGKIDNNANDPANDLYTTDLSVKGDGGFGSNFRYKDFSLSLFFHFRIQKILADYANMGYGGILNTSPQIFYNSWSYPGERSTFAKLTTQGDQSYANYYNYSDGVYTDGSFIRLQNLELAYTIPTNFMKKIQFINGKIYLRAENVFLLTKYHGLDPEAGSIFGGMPPLKTIVAGIQCSF